MTVEEIHQRLLLKAKQDLKDRLNDDSDDPGDVNVDGGSDDVDGVGDVGDGGLEPMDVPIDMPLPLPDPDTGGGFIETMIGILTSL